MTAVLMKKADAASSAAWTAEEDKILLEAYDDVGNKWTCISKLLSGRTDNAVKNRYALLQRKRCAKAAQRQGSATQIRKRSKAEPAPPLECGRYEDVLRHAPAAPVPHYTYVQPSEFYSGVTSATATETANLQLLPTTYNMQHLHPHMQHLHPSMQHLHPHMQHLHPSMQHLHPTVQPRLFQSQAPDTSSLMRSLSGGLHGSQYSRLPSNMYEYSSGNVASADSVSYGYLVGHPVGQQHQHPVSLGLASGPGTAVAADSSGTPNSTGTVTGHPSFFRQSSMLIPDLQGTRRMDGPLQPEVRDPCHEYSHHPAMNSLL